MDTTARLALAITPESLKYEPVLLCIDDTMVTKYGQKFEDVSKLLFFNWRSQQAPKRGTRFEKAVNYAKNHKEYALYDNSQLWQVTGKS